MHKGYANFDCSTKAAYLLVCDKQVRVVIKAITMYKSRFINYSCLLRRGDNGLTIVIFVLSSGLISLLMFKKALLTGKETCLNNYRLIIKVNN